MSAGTEKTDITQEQIVEIMRGERFVMLTSVAPDGSLHSHPMTPQEVTDDADVWFFIGLGTEQADALKANPHVNASFAHLGSWLSVAGQITFVDDRAKIDELWSDSVAAWYDGGKDDPNLGLVRLDSESAQFWGQPGGKAAALASIVKARVSGERPKGQSATTEL